MKSVVASPGAVGSLAIGEAPEPDPEPNEALIRVTCFSLNRGELRRAEQAAAGTQIGWDTVGVIDRPARDGSGPGAGTRVVGLSLKMQGWAERAAIPTAALAQIPDAVNDADAATLPVAGLTALYGLERCERLLGGRVLITGATGGVGYFACQLAKAMGAHVSALVRHGELQVRVGTEVAPVLAHAVHVLFTEDAGCFQHGVLGRRAVSLREDERVLRPFQPEVDRVDQLQARERRGDV